MLFIKRKRVYGQFCIETLHERHNGIERLVVCLSEYLSLHCVYIVHVHDSSLGVSFSNISVYFAICLAYSIEL